MRDFAHDYGKNDLLKRDLRRFDGAGGMLTWYFRQIEFMARSRNILNGAMVRELRVAAGFSIPQMASLAKIDKASVYRIEECEIVDPKTSITARLAEIFGVTMESLLKK